MRFLQRAKGSTRTGRSPRSTVAAIVAVLALALGGGVLAAGTASAEVWNPNVSVGGRVVACGPHSFPVGIHYWGNTGDRGWAPVGRGGQYRIDLHRVAPRGGEFVWGSVDCAWHPPVRFGFPVQRPWRGNFVWHTV